MLGSFSTHSCSIETIVSGARLLAAGQELDADTLERIIRRAAHIACEARLQAARKSVGNDNGRQA
jgi:hypothetical protein